MAAADSPVPQREHKRRTVLKAGGTAVAGAATANPATAAAARQPDTRAPAAIGNAIFHATGRRPRDLPFTRDKLL